QDKERLLSAERLRAKPGKLASKTLSVENRARLASHRKSAKHQIPLRNQLKRINVGIRLCGWIAQSVEQRTENPCVGGSIPPPATIYRDPICAYYFGSAVGQAPPRRPHRLL